MTTEGAVGGEILRKRTPIEVIRNVSQTLKTKTGLAYTEGLGLALALDLAADELEAAKPRTSPPTTERSA